MARSELLDTFGFIKGISAWSLDYDNYCKINFREQRSTLIKLDNHLVVSGNILAEQSEIASESMRVLSAQNWVGFILRAKNDLIPKISDFCKRRDQIKNVKIDTQDIDLKKWEFGVEQEYREIRNMNFD